MTCGRAKERTVSVQDKLVAPSSWQARKPHDNETFRKVLRVYVLFKNLQHSHDSLSPAVQKCLAPRAGSQADINSARDLMMIH
jgi:hypothetical protein